MNCITYARVSTDKQVEKELSIPAQLSAMRQYAVDRGWQVLEEFVEAGASARSADRPVLRHVLQRSRDEEQPKVDIVLVHKLDRLARNLADHVAIRASLRQSNVTLASVSEGLENSVSGQLVEHILASMAEFYSANLSEEVKKGMRQKVLQGGWPHRPPRGYRIVRHDLKSTVAIDDLQGPLIRRAFELCLSGYRGLVDLRLRMASAGLRTRTEQPVSNAYLSNLLTNPFYAGMLRWKGQVYPAVHPPIVSPAMFEQVQRILKARSRPLIRVQAKFLLTGIAQCAECGRLVGGEVHRRWKYYRCRGSFRSFDRCKAKYGRVDTVHRDLERILQRTLLTGPAHAEIKRTLTQMALERVEAEDRKDAAVRYQLSAIHQRERHLNRAFTDGLMTSEAHREALDTLNTKRTHLQKLLSDIPRGTENRLDCLRSAVSRARSTWDVYIVLSLAEQRLLVQTVFETIHVADTGVVRFVLKPGTFATAA